MVKRINRILLAVGCGLLLLLSWLTVITARSDAQKQAELLAQADAYIQDEIYIRALPLLEEAAGYDAKHTIEAEEALKNVYLHLIGQSGPCGLCRSGGVLSGGVQGIRGVRRFAGWNRQDRQRGAYRAV